ncbi:39S ribosomal protein L38, mitochondrial isoform X2 [Corythoichthys intestinalis]|uniref:39S ribosomal protein L38, mitochondrial isoform X2 n=1 Tax=Corythoichthys intestinalis TaxID=161448 RepID=UPI0025A63688|nr:39S ribosomal protein L38, mitochondrial isoform X2 [Corythoichthys intestinalis]XP_061807980.1 large ribosomal subunit protein mL38-like [Nerophis lumbriciformis]
MALRSVFVRVSRKLYDFRVNNARTFVTTAFLCRRKPPLGPMPNEDIDVQNIDTIEKYRTYNRYFKHAQVANSKPVWWHTYRGYMEKEDPELGVTRVDIGLRRYRLPRTHEVRERSQVMKTNKKNVELERSCRLRTFKINLDAVQETWEKSNGPFQIRRLADHYGIYRDLFPMAFFLPQIPLRIRYGEETSAQVHYGNPLTPTEAASAPSVSFNADEGTLWTLLLTSPDEHLLDNEAEYLHWLVANIPDGALQSGEELCHYLPPFPARGTGFHRYVYILFQQEGPINFQEDRRPSPCHLLEHRTFKTVDFYRKHQDSMTPAGLAFFQSQWDESVTTTFHNTLDMAEPVFEFIRPPVYHPPQVKFPHRQPLRYLDRYRDGKEQTYGIY